MTYLEIFGHTFKWWLVVELIGLAALPLAFRALRWLPGRGYALAKSLGLLLSGYLLWLLGSLGFLRNTPGGAVLAVALVALLGLLVYRRGEPETGRPPARLLPWLREQSALVIAAEAVFAIALFGWALFRASNPAIAATEKPMEFAFLNSILRDAVLPPSDPWLAGYAISYYYFGYVLMAMLVSLTGVAPGIGFNLAIALLMALAATGAFALGYDLVAGHATRPEPSAGRARAPAAARAPRSARARRLPAILTGVLAAVLLVVMGNWEAPLELAYRLGWFPTSFWNQVLDIRDLTVPSSQAGPAPAQPLWPWDQGGPRYWWWWRASRVIHDCSPAGGTLGVSWPCAGTGSEVEIIDEFPFFSFLLGDMHPHVLALPFAVLALGLGYNLMLRALRERLGAPRALVHAPGEPPTDAPPADAPPADAPAEVHAEAEDDEEEESGLAVWLAAAGEALGGFGLGQLLLYGVVFGALAFLNTWDFPAYLAVALLGLGLARWRLRGRLDGRVIGYTALIGASIAVLGIVLYLPFWIGFRSQLGGLLPNLVFPTRLPPFLVFFGPFIVLELSLLVYLALRLAQRGHFDWQAGLKLAFGLLAALLLALVVFVLVAATTEQGRTLLERAREVLALDASLPELLGSALRLRLIEPWLPLVLTIGLALAVALLAGGTVRTRRETAGEAARSASLAPGTLFALALIAMSLLVTLFPEFFYLRDLFGSRINTIFKFYYQAWVMSAIAGAFAVYFLYTRLSPAPRATFLALAAGAIGLGLLYPVLALPAKARDWAGAPTLDGMAARLANSPSDLEGVRWLNANVAGQPVILEAVGGSYTEHARVSANTGLPTVLGWPGHEDQWRGELAGELKGTRETDVRTIYSSGDWRRAQELLDAYEVEYVYLGPLERQLAQPGPALEKFAQNWTIVYQSPDGQVTIFQRPGPLASR